MAPDEVEIHGAITCSRLTVSRRESKKVQEPFLKALRGGSAESLFQQSLREHGTGRFTSAIGADSS
jgi:hypothetical protein